MTDDKAENLMIEGEKRITKFAPFTSSDEKHEKARDKFLQAATQFKAASNWSRAAQAYQRASDMSTILKNESDFVSDCESAAMALRKAGDKRANDLLMRVVDMYDKAGKYSQAAKFCVTLADSAEFSATDTLEWLNKAIRYYRNDGSKVTAAELVQRTANVHLSANNYSDARKIFEKLGREALDDRLSRGSARKYFFAALLCELANLSGTNLDEGVSQLSEHFNQYQDEDNQFNEHTREHMLIRALISAIEAGDLNAYEEAVNDYDNIVPLDDKKSKMILRAKQLLRNQGLR